MKVEQAQARGKQQLEMIPQTLIRLIDMFAKVSLRKSKVVLRAIHYMKVNNSGPFQGIR